jgi:protein gp37
MADGTGIEWTEATWNPVAGCSKVSPGCAHCYAETISLRFGHTQRRWTPQNAAENVQLHPERLDQPLKWRRPRLVFVNSMSDLFHELVPDLFIAEVFLRMAAARQHTFQVLTKRPERMRDVVRRLYEDIPELEERPLSNVWLGTSIENSRFACRAEAVRETPAAVRFISAEPLLGPIAKTLDLTDIDWVIVGGESGPKHRPMHIEWARELRKCCEAKEVAFFFKQWGGHTPKAGGRLLDGIQHDEMPTPRSLAPA